MSIGTTSNMQWLQGPGGSGTVEYTAGNGIDIDNTNHVISVDPTEVQEKLTAGENVTISNNVISANPQRQSDWNQTDSEAVDFIRNKPTNQLLPSATSSDEGKVLSVDSNGDPEWISGGGVVQVQSDWTEDDSSDEAYIKHKPTTKPVQAGTGITVTEFADNITIASTVPEQEQSDWSEGDPSEKSYIQNKPSTKQLVAGANVTITEGANQITITSTGAGGVAVQADWSQSDSSQLDYIKNKPSIPAAQVQSDWSEGDPSEKSFILNKPLTKPIVAGNGIKITETSTEIVISLA